MENSHFPSKSGAMYNKKIREGGFVGLLWGFGFGFGFCCGSVLLCVFLFLFWLEGCIAKRSDP